MAPITKNTKRKAENNQKEEGPQKRACRDNEAHEENKYWPLMRATGSSSKAQAEGSKSYDFMKDIAFTPTPFYSDSFSFPNKSITRNKKRKAEKDQEEEGPQKRACRDNGAYEEKKYRPLIRATRTLPNVPYINWFTSPDYSEWHSEPMTTTTDHVIEVHLTKEEFSAKLKESSTMLGQGGDGEVFAGVRISDSKPVPRRGRPPTRVLEGPLHVQCPDSGPVLDEVSSARCPCGRPRRLVPPAESEVGRRSRFGRLIRSPVRD
ncbi:uncharacterized protein LOC114477288 isoform X2 [Gouania willdenowi]|uniref:uncharacterized protein LOC114477288 isoform X2 n=1 Tax=Gouania willdenowi TaxID=441366 RepID=UPI001056853E|nr:uncharacterized protein LOC114477288 isoform X2 [Gouania willdenowi]